MKGLPEIRFHAGAHRGVAASLPGFFYPGVVIRCHFHGGTGSVFSKEISQKRVSQRVGVIESGQKADMHEETHWGYLQHSSLTPNFQLLKTKQPNVVFAFRPSF